MSKPIEIDLTNQGLRAPAFGTALSSADADQAASRLAPDGLQSTGARSVDDIIARMKVVEGRFLDFQFGDLLERLPFGVARVHLKEGVTADEWSSCQKTGDPLDDVREYLPFAWEKANNCRGISASRSVDHMKAWLWLAGFDVDADFEARYEYYGKPCLVVASEIVGFDWRREDDGQWVNNEDGPALGASDRDALAEDATTFARSLTSGAPK